MTMQESEGSGEEALGLEAPSCCTAVGKALAVFDDLLSKTGINT